MERLNKINDKTWNAVEGYRFFNRLKNDIFYMLMEYYKKLHEEHIKTDLGFSLDLSTDIEKIDGEFYFVLQCDIHLTDKDGNEIDTLNHSKLFDDIGCLTPVQISEEIDDFINEIVYKIERYERSFEKCEDLPF